MVYGSDADPSSVIGRAYTQIADKRGPAGAVELSGEALARERADYARTRSSSYKTDGSGRTIPGSLVYYGPEPEDIRFFVFFGYAPS